MIEPEMMRVMARGWTRVASIYGNQASVAYDPVLATYAKRASESWLDAAKLFEVAKLWEKDFDDEVARKEQDDE